MSKEIENKVCPVCESEYKLVYDLDTTNGHPKWCPFCQSDIYEENEETDEEVDNTD